MKRHNNCKKRIVCKSASGGLRTIQPHEANRLEDESDEDFLERMAQNLVPKDLPYCIMEDPSKVLDRTFRMAWVWRGENNPKLTIDISQAKQIWVDKWRTARKPILETLDIEYLKASERKDESELDKIAQKKQELRDVTKHDLSSVNDVAELKKVWPSTLVG
jgi:hypothetical protein